MKQYHIERDGQQYGPFSADQIIEMLQSSQLILSDNCWHDGISEWKPLSEVFNLAAPTEPSPLLITPASQAPVATEANTKAKETKWLWFWNYISLPLGVIWSFLYILSCPILAIVLVPVAGVYIATIIGLHCRKKWGWIMNWIAIGVTYLNLILPNPAAMSNKKVEVFWTLVGINIFIYGLVWIWPNVVYWKKRKCLFR